MSMYKICDYKICDHLYKWVCDLRKRSYATEVESAVFNTHQSHPGTWDGKTEEFQAPLILKEKAGRDERKRVM